VILRFKPIFKRFQSPKYIIKAKDPRLASVHVVILGFLTIEPPPPGTQDAQLPASLITKLLYTQEQPIPSDDEIREHTLEPTQEVTDKDFKVFYQQEDFEDLPGPFHHRPLPTQTNTNQEATNTPKGMVLEEKTPNLLALLTTRARGASPAVPVVLQPPALAPIYASFGDATDKKRKRVQGVKDLRMLKRERLHAPPSSPLPRKPELLGLSKRRVLPLGPPKELKGNSSQRPLPGGLLLC